jgi:hypothetical protein
MRDGNLTETASDYSGPDREPQTSVTFPMSDGIVENVEGYFVPRGLFGEGVTTAYREETGPDGLTVTIFARKGLSQDDTQPAKSRAEREQELRWLEENREEYSGQWVALDGNRLSAAGMSAVDVYDKARAIGIKKPFVTRVESKTKLPFGGW